MSGSTTTVRPNATAQLGSWTVVGAATAHAATSDNLDSSYVQLTPRCRTDTQVLRLGLPTITIPTGAQISSVGVRVRIQTTVFPAPQPQCLGWFRCQKPQGIVQTVVNLILLLLFGFRCPQQPTSVFVDQNLEDLSVDPSGNPWTLASFNAFEVNLGRDDAAANPLRISEVYVDVNYSEVSVIAVTGPTGTISNTCRPTVTWTYTSPQSDPQQAYQVAIYTAAQVAAGGFVPFVTAPVQQSGLLLGENLQWTLSTDIVNGGWSAYVQVQSVWPGPGAFPSAIASGSWTQSIASAPDPVLSSATFDPVFNRNQLVFVPSSSSPVTDLFAVQTSRDFGLSWTPVRNGLLIAANGMTPVTLFDYEAPLNVTSQYRVLAYRNISGIPQPSAHYSNVLSVTPSVDRVVWLKDPFDSSLNTPFPVDYMGDTRTVRRVQAVIEPIAAGARADNIVISGPQFGPSGTLTCTFTSKHPLYWPAFKNLDATQHVLLIQWPNGEEYYLKFGPGSAGSDMSYTWEVSPDVHKVTVSYTTVATPPITA